MKFAGFYWVKHLPSGVESSRVDLARARTADKGKAIAQKHYAASLKAK